MWKSIFVINLLTMQQSKSLSKFVSSSRNKIQKLLWLNGVSLKIVQIPVVSVYTSLANFALAHLKKKQKNNNKGIKQKNMQTRRHRHTITRAYACLYAHARACCLSLFVFAFYNIKKKQKNSNLTLHHMGNCLIANLLR